MNKFDVNGLVIEITRRCNATCPHCLRGDAQSVSIREEYLERLTANIRSVDGLTISGGEPSLAIPELQTLLKYVIDQKITIYEFYLVTNGLENTKSLIDVCNLWYDHLTHSYGSKFTVAMSNTVHHPEPPDVHKQMLGRTSYGKIGTRQNMFDLGDTIMEGRALQHKDKIIFPVSPLDFGGQGSLKLNKRNRFSGDFYLNVFGQVITESCLSYETQDSGEFTLGHIFELFL
jgi:hypothetical protein